jgi:TonB-dependent receptor-like protein
MKLFSVVAAAAVVACASAGGGGTKVDAGSANIITADQIAASHQSNAYEVVSRLRPNFLKSRGRTTVYGQGSDYAAVFLDGQSYGDLSSLRNISASQIGSIRFIRGTDAVTTYGMQYGGGVIDVRTK